MSKFKHAALVLVAASLMTAQAQASEPPATQVQAQSVAAFSDAEIAAMFESSGPSKQLAMLSSVEMKETEGAWGFWGAAIGGLGGFSGFAINNRISGHNWSWANAGAATFRGAMSGATAGPVGVVWGFNRNIAFGTAQGVFNRLR